MGGSAAQVDAFVARQPFPLDDFQREAIEHLAADRSVLVSAPTGAGKTVVAEFAVHAALGAGRRCIYTTPLKALSNQKFRDLREYLGEAVGLMTGDVVINAEARILIMTTEILRNILQTDPDRVADVSHVILDEAHYIGSEGRGTVWEETIVFLGKGTLVVALSATIPNAQELASWVSEVHRPMSVVFHAERPVPLDSYVATPDIQRLFDARGRLAVRAFRLDGWVDLPDPVDVVRGLKLKRMLPAIYFIFSRLGCEQTAQDLIAADLDLTTKDERLEIAARVEEAVAKTPGLLGSTSSRKWLDALPNGVAPHHAGLLPPLKLVVEKLFQRGLIKVVFATETLAAGINMPARTVVVSNLLKRTDDGVRMLHVGEFAQMTGRAGRRGMDKVGHAVVLASHRYTPHDIAHLVRDPVEPLRSRFTLNYNMVANLTHRYEPPAAKRIVEQSFASFQGDQVIAHLVEQRREVQRRLGRIDLRCPVLPDAGREDLLGRFATARGKRDSLKKRLGAMMAQRRYLPRPVAAERIARAAIGSWLLVHLPGRTRPELALLLHRQLTRSGDAHFTVLTDLPALIRLGTAHLVAVLDAAPVSELPPQPVLAKAGALSFLQQIKPAGYEPRFPAWLESSGLDLADFGWTLEEPPDIRRAKAKLDEVLLELGRLPCVTCRVRVECSDLVDEHRLLGKEESALGREIEQVKSAHWREFQALHRVLEELGYMRGRELLARGAAIANIRTTNELMAAECVAGGFLEDLGPVAVATVVSCLVAEPPRGRQAWHPLPYRDAVYKICRQLALIGRDLVKVQRQFSVDLPVYLEREYAGLTQAWAEGGAWADLVAASGIDEGQLVRHLRQVIDLLQQLREVPGVGAAFHAKARDAAALLDRDIVKEVF
ncbi:MAG: DEAD/DEAH box helicase [Candidatus Sericytochromatia bacterium]|nr:DEAD/DEAH box helicase [Candidatus Tanganyikabacteria bacterium]